MVSVWRAFWGGDPVLDGIVVRRLTVQQVALLLRYSGTALRAMLIAQALILIAWSCGSVVRGFALYDGTPGRYNAISHTGFWLGYETFVVVVGLMSIAFAVSALGRTLALEMATTIRALGFYAVLLVLAIAAHAAHIVACALELSDCTSTLCVEQNGFLIALIVLLGCLVVLEFVQLLYVAQYRKHLRYARLWEGQLMR